MAGISWGTMARLNTNEYVSLEVIDKLCNALDCQPGDLMEFIKKKNENIKTGGIIPAFNFSL